MRVLGGWIALTPELPAKLLFGRHVWDCAQHADAWGRRLSASWRDAEQLLFDTSVQPAFARDHESKLRLGDPPEDLSTCLRRVGTSPSASRSAGRSSKISERISRTASRARSCSSRARSRACPGSVSTSSLTASAVRTALNSVAGDPIVQLAREPVAFLHHGQLAAPLGELRVLALAACAASISITA